MNMYWNFISICSRVEILNLLSVLWSLTCNMRLYSNSIQCVCVIKALPGNNMATFRFSELTSAVVLQTKTAIAARWDVRMKTQTEQKISSTCWKHLFNSGIEERLSRVAEKRLIIGRFVFSLIRTTAPLCYYKPAPTETTASTLRTARTHSPGFQPAGRARWAARRPWETPPAASGARGTAGSWWDGGAEGSEGRGSGERRGAGVQVGLSPSSDPCSILSPEERRM